MRVQQCKLYSNRSTSLSLTLAAAPHFDVRILIFSKRNVDNSEAGEQQMGIVAHDSLMVFHHAVFVAQKALLFRLCIQYLPTIRFDARCVSVSVCECVASVKEIKRNEKMREAKRKHVVDPKITMRNAKIHERFTISVLVVMVVVVMRNATR